ncbi:MAG: hypothetical protein ABIA92_03620 [Patescibacteria group bacterium]
MRSNIFCILLAVAAVGATGVVTVKYQELQDLCQVTGQADMFRSAAPDFDIEVALNEGFMTLNEAVFMDNDPVDYDADFCEEVINLLEESISEALGASDGSSEGFKDVFVREIQEGLTKLTLGFDEDEFSEEDDWLDEDDIFDEGEEDWLEDDWPEDDLPEDDWFEDDWPEDDEDWINEDLDADVFGD